MLRGQAMAGCESSWDLLKLLVPTADWQKGREVPSAGTSVSVPRAGGELRCCQAARYSEQPPYFTRG